MPVPAEEDTRRMVKHSPTPIPVARLIRAAKGFSCLTWGIPLGLLLFASKTVGLRGVIQVNGFSQLRLPAYALAVVMIYLGMMHLYRAGAMTRSWGSYVHKGLFLSFLLMYFAPFFHWWDTRPYQTAYLVNVLLLLFSSIWLLYVTNQLAGLMGLALDDDTFYIEARLCGVAVILLMVLPYLGLIGYAVRGMIAHHSTLFAEMSQAPRALQAWMLALFLLPVPLTMASTWKAREICLHRIARLDTPVEETPAEPAAETHNPDLLTRVSPPPTD